VLTAIDEQSPDIALGTNDDVGGAGDQGMMFGYACKETPDLMPLPITMAHELAYALARERKAGNLPDLLPDGKTQVTVEYDANGNPVSIPAIIISSQHLPTRRKARSGSRSRCTSLIVFERYIATPERFSSLSRRRSS
jgi:S-adenosylmethionine synthetase